MVGPRGSACRRRGPHIGADLASSPVTAQVMAQGGVGGWRSAGSPPPRPSDTFPRPPAACGPHRPGACRIRPRPAPPRRRKGSTERSTRCGQIDSGGFCARRVGRAARPAGGAGAGGSPGGDLTRAVRAYACPIVPPRVAPVSSPSAFIAPDPCSLCKRGLMENHKNGGASIERRPPAVVCLLRGHRPDIRDVAEKPVLSAFLQSKTPTGPHKCRRGAKSHRASRCFAMCFAATGRAATL